MRWHFEKLLFNLCVAPARFTPGRGTARSGDIQIGSLQSCAVAPSTCHWHATRVSLRPKLEVQQRSLSLSLTPAPCMCEYCMNASIGEPYTPKMRTNFKWIQVNVGFSCTHSLQRGTVEHDNKVDLQLNVFMQALYALCMQSKVVQHRNL